MEFLGQRDFAHGTKLRMMFTSSDIVFYDVPHKADLSEGKPLVLFLPHKVYTRDAARQNVYHAHGDKSTVKTIKLMI
jgi:hypothetical protein